MKRPIAVTIATAFIPTCRSKLVLHVVFFSFLLAHSAIDHAEYPIHNPINEKDVTAKT